MYCVKCGNSNVTFQTSTYTKSKSRSFIWNLLMLCCTGGLWLIWMLIRKKKQKVITETWATCQTCGHHWKVK